MKRSDLSVRWILPSGAIGVYTILDGQFVEERYFGYTVNEAICLFIKKHKGANND